MGMILSFLLSLFTGSGGITGSIEKAYEANLNSKTEEERIASTNLLNALLQQQTIRLATAGQPLQKWLAFIFAAPFALHVLLIGIGTCIAAPLGWPVLAWTLHVPPFPAPYEGVELGIIGFFYGYAAITHTATVLAGAITSGKGA
jgi:hypothetical protein